MVLSLLILLNNLVRVFCLKQDLINLIYLKYIAYHFVGCRITNGLSGDAGNLTADQLKALCSLSTSQFALGLIFDVAGNQSDKVLHIAGVITMCVYMTYILAPKMHVLSIMAYIEAWPFNKCI